jgi:hypothetical protein
MIPLLPVFWVGIARTGFLRPRKILKGLFDVVSKLGAQEFLVLVVSAANSRPFKQNIERPRVLLLLAAAAAAAAAAGVAADSHRLFSF